MLLLAGELTIEELIQACIQVSKDEAITELQERNPLLAKKGAELPRPSFESTDGFSISIITALKVIKQEIPDVQLSMHGLVSFFKRAMLSDPFSAALELPNLLVGAGNILDNFSEYQAARLREMADVNRNNRIDFQLAVSLMLTEVKDRPQLMFPIQLVYDRAKGLRSKDEEDPERIMTEARATAKGIVRMRTMQEWKMAFLSLDRNNSGELSFEELRDGIFELGGDGTAQELHDLVKTVDDNHNNLLDLDEFKKLVENFPVAFCGCFILVDIFQAIDRQAKGVITWHDIQMNFAQWGFDLEDDLIEFLQKQYVCFYFF